MAFSKSATRRPIMLAKSVKAPRSSLTSICRVTRMRRAKVCRKTSSWLSDMVPACTAVLRQRQQRRKVADPQVAVRLEVAEVAAKEERAAGGAAGV